MIAQVRLGLFILVQDNIHNVSSGSVTLISLS